MALVDIFAEPVDLDSVIEELCQLDNLEELYEVTGEFDLVSLVSASDIEEFREVLKNKIMKIKGVRSTKVKVMSKSHLSKVALYPLITNLRNVNITKKEIPIVQNRLLKSR